MIDQNKNNDDNNNKCNVYSILFMFVINCIKILFFWF